MSLIEAPLQSGYPDEFSDAMASMTASILQEQLAPILQTLREHAKLLDLHAALLNHSTAMNRYNVGKLDDIRDFQNNINFKLQFYVNPEDRWYPNYQSPRTPTPTTSTETLSIAESRLLAAAAADAHIPSDEPTQSIDTPSSSSVATAPGSPDRPSTPAATEPADSRPTTPRQRLGDGFSVVPGPSRRLQRERPFSVAPDPMWNSSREINPFERLAAPAPPPPYVSPPTYAEVVPAERIDIEAATVVRAPTLIVRHASVSSSVLTPAVVEEEEVATSLSSNTVATTSNITSTSTAGGDLTAFEDEATHDDADQGPSPQLSEKARGKKRMREDSEEERTSDEEDEALLENLLGEGGSGSGHHNLNTSGRDDGRPDRKRVKTDTRISTDRLEDVDADVLMVARMGLVEELTDLERRRQVEKLKAIQKLYRSGLDSF